MVKFIGLIREDFLSEYISLFRFTTIDRFLELITNECLVFLNPSTWADPYERYYIERQYNLSGQSKALPMKDKVFCLCLSGTKSSEAFWKVYAPKEDGVRLTFNVIKLLSVLEKIKGCDIYIGKVNYQTTSEFSKIAIKYGDLIEDIKQNTIGEQQIKLILKKRISFNYENEVRIISIPQKTPKDSLAFKSKMNIKSFTTEYLFDPRLGEYHFKLIKDFMKKVYGLNASCSHLYRNPPLSPIVLG